MSKKWGFTKWNKEEFAKGMAEGTIAKDGNNAQARPAHGPLAAWKAQQSA